MIFLHYKVAAKMSLENFGVYLVQGSTMMAYHLKYLNSHMLGWRGATYIIYKLYNKNVLAVYPEITFLKFRLGNTPHILERQI